MMKKLTNRVLVTHLHSLQWRHNEQLMSPMTFQITSLTIVYSIVYSDADQIKHQSSASLVFVRGIHRWPVNSPAQKASNAENVSIWWRHHAPTTTITTPPTPSPLRNKMADISQATLQNAFSLMTLYEFQKWFYWSVVQRL